MKYFFALGNNPTLSAAEIFAIFNIKNPILLDTILIGEIDKFDEYKCIKKLGGTIKIGEIFYEAEHTNEINILNEIKKILPSAFEGKFKFGISLYGKSKLKIRQLGMEIKNIFKEKGISCRWVTGKEQALSSVIVEQNKLIDKGVEICIIKNQNQTFVGKTLSVQPFKELSLRDYGRPARDDHSGMLPPKLAQIMINLGARQNMPQNTTLLDPFCGSGTILTEAFLMNFNNLIGSDLSPKAIADTENNIIWVKNNFKLQNSNFKLFHVSATEISKKIPSNSIDIIVSEPYLGPQRGTIDIKKTKKELEQLYYKALQEFKKILKKNGRIVILFPVFQKNQDSIQLNPNLDDYSIMSPIPKELSANSIIKTTNRNTIIYGREGQKVWREIVILTLK